MFQKIDLNKCYSISKDIVKREIEGEIVIIPIVSGIGDIEDDIYSLNETGKVIWGMLDGKKKLKEIIKDLHEQYDTQMEKIEADVINIIKELVNKKLVVILE
ncbi:MAG: PqqD family protein [Thermodesulfobacteriota bacterium]|nr:PqqD family protein [Thermodesulfobacteriota bacterium]